MTAGLAGTLLILAVQSPTVVTPASPRLQPSCAPAAVDTFELVLLAPGQPERVVATLRRTWAPSREGGAQVCVLEQHYSRSGSSDLDSSIVNAGTLAPVRYWAQVDQEIQRFRFSADSATGTVQAGDSTPRVVAEGAPSPYFLGVADLEVLRALPLAAGFHARFMSYNPPRGFHDVEVQVEGVDSIAVGGKTTAAWRLGYQAGGAPTVLWLRRDNGALLRSKSVLRNGAVFWRRRLGDVVG
ncbi:MAG TPA: hypothetical protein VFV65_06300 [Gemmatimonadales bacterium]|nr:hypothetical protein [Gemmatimonadales bacterium]